MPSALVCCIHLILFEHGSLHLLTESKYVKWNYSISEIKRKEGKGDKGFLVCARVQKFSGSIYIFNAFLHFAIKY